MKKRLALFVAGLSVFAMTSASFAANTANVSVTSEPIRQAATCDKAGGFAITFDDKTTFNGGDQITADLDFGVTLCRDIDLEVGIDTNIAGNDASNFTSIYTIPALNTNSPIATSGGSFASANGGVIFKITGTSNSSRVTIDVMSDVNGDGTLESDPSATLTFNGTATTDVLELRFLDQAIYTPGAGDAGIFAPTVAGGSIYDGNDATAAQNTLCIDISEPTFTATKVNANLDSKADKYTWIPSNPQVAHIVSASQFLLESCKGKNTGRINLPGTASQGSTLVCTPIENDLDAQDGTDGFCDSVTTDYHVNNKMIIRTANGSPFESVNYQVQLEILVNGVTGANGVYWSDELVATAGYTTSALACAATDANGVNLGAATYTLADDTAATPSTDTDCTIAPAAKAVTLLTPASGLNLAAADSYLYINLPKMVFDTSEFVQGDVLSVKVTLMKAPCGELFTGTWEIGTAGCTTVAASNNLTFPYFAKTGNYVNAIIVTNTTATAGTANFVIYETDGDAFTATEAVAARNMFVNLLSNLTMTRIAGTGTFGDAKSYVTVSTDFGADGAAMITNPATGESIGYLPRQ